MCSRCVMDSSAAGITFDENGVCNFCADLLKRSGHVLFMDPAARHLALESFVNKVKAAGKGKRYDCIVGVSGGVDSSWVLVEAVRLGLRPLAVHMDNGWNSELAQNNIANLVRGLGVDLQTHVIDWHEYRKLMQAFFDADVLDVELLYDNAMFAVNYQQAKQHGVRYILGGTNLATEGIRIPENWHWFKFDKRNIAALGEMFSSAKLETFPAIGTIDFITYEYIRRIRWHSFLDMLEFNKADALRVLQSEYGYKPYPYKHYESIFTRFYQGYILPNKFGVDKRRLHFSSLVVSGQMSREEALAGLEGIPYPSERALEDDIQYFIKKMGWSERQLGEYILRPAVPHDSYPSEKPLWYFCLGVYKKYIRPIVNQ